MHREISPLWDPSSPHNPRAEADRRGSGLGAPARDWEWVDVPNPRANEWPGATPTLDAVRPGVGAGETVRDAWDAEFGRDADGGLRPVVADPRNVQIHGIGGRHFGGAGLYHFGDVNGRIRVRLAKYASPWMD